MSEAHRKDICKKLESTHTSGKLVDQIIKTSGEKQELWKSYVTNLSNNVPRLKFLYKLMVKPPFFLILQSNPLCRMNLLVSFAWFWPSSSVANPKLRVAIPRFLRKASAAAILFGDTRHTVDQSQRRIFYMSSNLQYWNLLPDKLRAKVVTRATTLFKLQCNNVVRQYEWKCCLYFFTLTNFNYFWIRNFFFPDTALVHKYPVNLAYECVSFLNPLWIRNRVDAESGQFFIQWRSKIEPSSLSLVL